MTRAFHVYIGFLIVFIMAPILIVAVVSFSGGKVPEFPPKSFSFQWYDYALNYSLFTRSAVNSAWLALISTVIAAPIAVAAALAIVRKRFPGRDAIQTFLLAPLIVPSIVIGLSILLGFATVGIRDIFFRLIGAHVLITFPYLVRTVIASLSRVDVTVEEAARTLGANNWRTFWHVTLPLIRPGIIAGMLFSFIVSFDNVSVSLFLTSARTNTLPLAILSYVEFNFDPSIAAISTMLILFSLGAAVILERVVGLRKVLGV
ncbi:MAG: ABC transporter permease [Alphaproteobacteria bacterium]|nr:ABC transporter permease [Alphaproteobacteria bacterium]